VADWQNSLRGRVAIVTGAAQGIGFAATAAVARAGAQVVISAVRGDAGEKKRSNPRLRKV